MRSRRWIAAGFAGVLALGTSACSGSDPPVAGPAFPESTASASATAPTPLPTACSSDRYSEVQLDAVPMDAPSPEAALAIVARGQGLSVDSYERVPLDPRRYKRKVADRYAGFATRRADGTVATVTVFMSLRAGWTLSSVQTCVE